MQITLSQAMCKTERMVHGRMEEGLGKKGEEESAVELKMVLYLRPSKRSPSDLSPPEAAAAAAIEVTIIAQEKCWCY